MSDLIDPASLFHLEGGDIVFPGLVDSSKLGAPGSRTEPLRVPAPSYPRQRAELLAFLTDAGISAQRMAQRHQWMFASA